MCWVRIRFAIEIPLRKNSAEKTRNDFRYSAGKRLLPRNSECVGRAHFGNSEKNGTEFREKMKFYGIVKMTEQNTVN